MEIGIECRVFLTRACPPELWSWPTVLLQSPFP